MGSVYLAHAERTPSWRVAVKLIGAQGGQDLARELRDRFEREVEALEALRHENIVKVITHGEDPEFGPYLVMELLDAGGTLYQRMADKALSPEEAAGVARDVARALHFAHGKGITHRDVKPENVWCTRERALLIDFGIAMRADRTRLTSTGRMGPGSLVYMAPERRMGTTVHDWTKVDVFGVGVLLYEMLSGRWATFDDVLPLDPGEEVPAPLRQAALGATSVGPVDRMDMLALLALLDQVAPIERLSTLATPAREPHADARESPSPATFVLETPQVRAPAKEIARKTRIDRPIAAVGLLLAAGLALAVTSVAGLGFWWWQSVGELTALGTKTQVGGDVVVDVMEPGPGDKIDGTIPKIGLEREHSEVTGPGALPGGVVSHAAEGEVPPSDGGVEVAAVEPVSAPSVVGRWLDLDPSAQIAAVRGASSVRYDEIIDELMDNPNAMRALDKMVVEAVILQGRTLEQAAAPHHTLSEAVAAHMDPNVGSCDEVDAWMSWTNVWRHSDSDLLDVHRDWCQRCSALHPVMDAVDGPTCRQIEGYDFNGFQCLHRTTRFCAGL